MSISTLHAPLPSHVMRLVIGTFRAIGQVAFAHNALSGIAIFVGCALSNAPAAGTQNIVKHCLVCPSIVLGLIATAITTIIGYAIPDERSRAINGIHGYNGFLVGMGVGYFDAQLALERTDWVQFCRLLLPLFFTSIFCSLIHFVLSKTKSPPFTFAYNIALACWLAFAVSLGPTSVFCPIFTSPRAPSVDDSILIEYGEIDFGWFIKAVLAGVGQVFFAPELTSSILILAGLAIGSPLIGILSFTGSIVGTGVAVITHSVKWMTELGLDGFNPVLAAVALGGFYYVPSISSFLYMTLGSIFCVAVRHVFTGFLIHPTGPSETFPFCLVATFMYLASLSTGFPNLVPKKLLSYPERHWVIAQTEPNLFHSVNNPLDV